MLCHCSLCAGYGCEWQSIAAQKDLWFIRCQSCNLIISLCIVSVHIFCNVNNKLLFNDSIWACLCCHDAKWIYSEYIEFHFVSEIFWHRTILAVWIIPKGSSFNFRLSLFITNKAFSLFPHSHIVPIPFDLLSCIKYKKRSPVLKTVPAALFHEITKNRNMSY